MRILALDTSTKSCSVGIVDDESVLIEIVRVSPETHSKHLMGMIHTAIEFSGLTLTELDGFAVTQGPGSFTGLRIGLSSIKGLAVATGKPLVGVSSLDALAMQASFSTFLICALLDARKGEVYCGRYRIENGILKKETREMVCTPAIAVQDITEPCVLAGDGASFYKQIIVDKIGGLSHFLPLNQNIIRASTVARLAVTRFKRGESDEINTFAPNYIRKSDAEMKRKTKMADI
ncbi:tRNA (adenosine(37)-N6)-threonylcarbamoyltransferase complex dimerization subunit type 1 TsaB [Thermodesulfobacteriota bacterium]